MLCAIPEAESDEHSGAAQPPPPDPLSSDGSLSEPRSEGLRDRSLGAEDLSDDGDRGLAAEEAAREGVQGLLSLVEEERSRMSKAVLASADGLSSAVTAARKRLTANIAAVEEQLKEEKRLLEEARTMQGSMPSNGVTLSTSSSAAIQELRDQIADREKHVSVLQSDKKALENERELLRSQLEESRNESAELRKKISSVEEENAGLKAEVAMLRSSLNMGQKPPEPSIIEPPTMQQSDIDAQAAAAVNADTSQSVNVANSSALLAATGAGVEGILKRKKAGHGVFEDPWKLRMHCYLVETVLECIPLQDGKVMKDAPTKERYDLLEWYVPPERKVPNSKNKQDPLRFDLVHRTEGQVVGFKAESMESCDRWIAALRSAAPKASASLKASLDSSSSANSTPVPVSSGAC